MLNVPETFSLFYLLLASSWQFNYAKLLQHLVAGISKGIKFKLADINWILIERSPATNPFSGNDIYQCRYFKLIVIPNIVNLPAWQSSFQALTTE